MYVAANFAGSVVNILISTFNKSVFSNVTVQWYVHLYSTSSPTINNSFLFFFFRIAYTLDIWHRRHRRKRGRDTYIRVRYTYTPDPSLLKFATGGVEMIKNASLYKKCYFTICLRKPSRYYKFTFFFLY